MRLISDEENDIAERMDKCVRFELHYDATSILTVHDSFGYEMTVSAAATAPLALDWVNENGPALVGEADLEAYWYTIENFDPDNYCPLTPVRTESGAPLAARAVIDLNPRQRTTEEGAKPVPPPKAPLVLLDAGILLETYDQCGEQTTTTHRQVFNMAHMSRYEGGEVRRFRFDQWITGEPPVVGTYDNQFNGSVVSGVENDFTLHLELRHRPAG